MTRRIGRVEGHPRDLFGTTPDLLGPFLGVRRWRVSPDGDLTGVHFQTVWQPGWNYARCFSLTTGKPIPRNVSATDVPGAHECSLGYSWGTGCGFYGYSTPNFTDHASPPQRGEIHVVGIVEGAGRMTGGSYGWRAQKARVRALYVIPKAERVGWPVEWLATYDQFLLRWQSVAWHPSVDSLLAAWPLTPPPEAGTP